MKLKIQGSNTLLNVKKGRIENEESDVIVNWLHIDMRSGPPQFYAIHRKAGAQLFNAVMSYEVGMNSINPCDCFTTLPGLLDCRCVFHVIIPMVKKTYVRAFLHMAETIKTYKKDNLCRNMSLYIPEEHNSCLAGVKEFLLDCGLDEVTIVYSTDEEREVILEFFDRFVDTKKDRYKFIDNALETIGNMRMLKPVEWLLWGRKLKKHGSIEQEEEFDSGAES